ncbi:MAG TPA: tetratricopeptide repeat protein [Longimicrobiaceae bacterium]|nr:tetratricopeptide repeat protein [Longimicrobiaceae bacterium]
MTRHFLPRLVRPLALCALLIAISASPRAVDVAAAQAQSPVAGAAALVKQRRYAEAQRVLAPYARAHPADGAAALWLGQAYLGQDSSDQAVAWLEKAAPRLRTAEAYMALAQAYGAQASEAMLFSQPFLTRKLRDAMQTAVDLEPRNVKARLALMQFHLGTPWLYGGSKGTAEEQVAQLNRVSPYFGSVGRALLQANTNDIPGAERTLAALGRQYPDSADPAAMLSGLYRQRRQWDQAWAVLDAFQRRNPANVRILLDVGATALASNQRLPQGERALAAYIAAPRGEDMPAATVARLQLGQIYEKSGRKELARAQYQQALREDPHMLPARSALKALDRPAPRA